MQIYFKGTDMRQTKKVAGGESVVVVKERTKKEYYPHSMEEVEAISKQAKLMLNEKIAS